MEQRFIRNIPAISPRQQSLLRTKRAAIIGCGGLGGYLAEFLARLGLGGISLCDGDSFEETNLNRQCLALPENLGLNKAKAAARRIEMIDPSVEIRCFEEKLSSDNWRGILSGCHIVMDALDNVPARLLLEDACSELELPLIHGAVEGWTAQVCPVYPGSNILHKLYAETPREGGKSVLPHVPPLCAGLQCSLAAKLLLGTATEEDFQLFVLDSQSMDFACMKL